MKLTLNIGIYKILGQKKLIYLVNIFLLLKMNLTNSLIKLSGYCCKYLLKEGTEIKEKTQLPKCETVRLPFPLK